MEEKRIKPIITHVDYGVASFYKKRNVIEVNKRLLKPKHAKLYKAIINHEMKHWSGEKHVDLNDSQMPQLKFWLFVFSNPSSWIHLLPIWYKNKTWIVNKEMLGFWLIILGGITFWWAMIIDLTGAWA